MRLEETKGKWVYILYLFITTLILGYGFIGATQPIKDILNFYLLWLFVPSVFVFVVDFVTKRGDMEEIDTVTWEDPHIKFLDNKNMIIAGVLISAILGWQIISQGVGLVGVPEFNIFEGAIGNALLSGLIGLYENLAFFGIIYPSVRKIISKYLDSKMLGIAVALIIASGSFMGYHAWRYGMNEAALYSVLFFAVINVVFVQVSNSLLWSDMLHFTNNFIVSLGYAAQVVVMLIL